MLFGSETSEESLSLLLPVLCNLSIVVEAMSRSSRLSSVVILVIAEKIDCWLLDESTLLEMGLKGRFLPACFDGNSTTFVLGSHNYTDIDNTIRKVPSVAHPDYNNNLSTFEL